MITLPLLPMNFGTENVLSNYLPIYITISKFICTHRLRFLTMGVSPPEDTNIKYKEAVSGITRMLG